MKTALQSVCARALLCIALACLTGCNTLNDSDRMIAHEREDMNIMRADIDRLSGRLEQMEMENARLGREVEQVRGAVSSAGSDRAEAQARMSDIERRLQALDAAREKDRQAIIDQLSAKISEILKAGRAAPARPRTASRSEAAGGGQAVHEVQAGETLSAIAARYNVRIDDIIQANGLQDPDHLVNGQKLVIP